MDQGTTASASAVIGHPAAGDVAAFDPEIVNVAVLCLQGTEQTKDWGSPERTWLCKEPLGLGVEWSNGMKKAVAFRGDDAMANYTEAKRRIDKWIAAGK